MNILYAIEALYNAGFNFTNIYIDSNKIKKKPLKKKKK